MFRRMGDFTKCWQEEAAKTLAVLRAIPETAITTSVTPEHRDLRRMAWHLVETLLEMPGRIGLKLDDLELMKGSSIVEPPATMAEIARIYSGISASLLSGLSGWGDSDLEVEDEMYGETWKRGFTLFVLVTHQTHHRAQMTVLMRQAGLRVPDIYGPAKEGWAAYGIEAPKI